MKKILLSIFIVNILLTFVFIISLKDNEIKNNINKIGNTNSFSISINKNVDNFDKEKAINLIQETVEKYEGSINKKVYFNNGNFLKISQYVYMNDPKSYLGELKIIGNSFIKYDKSDSLISNIDVDNENMIGKIETLKGKDVFEIRTLHSFEKSNKSLSGSYEVNINNNYSKDDFILELSNNLDVSVEELFGASSDISSWLDSVLLILIILLYLLELIIVLYSIFFRFKELGIKNMIGYSNKDIRLSFLKDITKIYFLAVIISFLGISIYYLFNKSKVLLETSILSFGIALALYLVTILVLLLPLVFINKVDVSAVIKNKKPTELINRTNNVFKVLVTSITLILISYLIGIYIPIRNYYVDNYEKWEITKKYAYANLSYMETDFSDDEFIWEMENMKKLYIDMVNKGAIEINIPSYLWNRFDNEANLKYAEEAGDPLYKLMIEYKGITVNNNYLKINPIYDIEGNQVSTGEDENIIYVLIPEKYKDDQVRILEAYMTPLGYSFPTMPNSELHKRLPELFDEEEPEKKAIIVKDNQKYFTFDIDKAGETNNYIIDPVVGINNIKLEAGGDISRNRGVYFLNDNLESPFSTIKDSVSKYGLESYYNEAYIVYEQVEQRAIYNQSLLMQIIPFFIVSMIVFVILVIYLSIIRMEKNKFDNSIKILHGYSFLARHRLFYILTVIEYLVLIVLLRVFNFFKGTEFLLLGIVLLIIDLIMSTIIIYIFERKNLKNILKGN